MIARRNPGRGRGPDGETILLVILIIAGVSVLCGLGFYLT